MDFDPRQPTRQTKYFQFSTGLSFGFFLGGGHPKNKIIEFKMSFPAGIF